MWTKFAHSLKARYYNRISNKGNFDSDIMNSISNGFDLGKDVCQLFAPTKPQSNPWYQFIVVDREGYINLSGTMIDTMTAREIPIEEMYIKTLLVSTFKHLHLQLFSMKMNYCLLKLKPC